MRWLRKNASVVCQLSAALRSRVVYREICAEVTLAIVIGL